MSKTEFLFRNGIDIVQPGSSIITQVSIVNATDFTSIYDTDFGLAEGVLVQNINSSGNILVKHANTDHSTKSGYLLAPGKSVFIECGNLKDVQAVNESKTGSLDLQIIGA